MGQLKVNNLQILLKAITNTSQKCLIVEHFTDIILNSSVNDVFDFDKKANFEK